MRRFLVALVLLGAAFAVSPAQAQNRFWLQNNTGVTIQEAFVSPSRLSNWGPDILGSGVLAAGQQVWVTPYFGDCLLDVRVRFANGREETRMGMNACTLSRVAFGGGGGGGGGAGGRVGAAIGGGPGVRGGNPSFNFVNQSGQVVRELYASLSSDSNWGPDRLGANMLPPGQGLWVDLPQNGVCTVDIKVVYASGASVERRSQQTCSVQNLLWR